MKLRSLFSTRKSGGELQAKKHASLELHKHFKIVQVLGKGAFAVVYQVRRLHDGRDYALKHINISSLRPEERADLVNEIRLLSSLRHPALMSYHEAFVEGEELCIVTELVPGGELAGLLRRREEHRDWLPERQVWSYFLQLLLGVRYLHHNKVLHRDLKPQNVLLGAGGRLKIADLGISAKLDRVFACSPMGTPQYLSPEMYLRRPYSYSADIWALGCILHEMCTLRPLFQAASVREIRNKVVDAEIPSIPHLYSPQLGRLVRWLLQQDPAQRPTVDEILDLPEVQARLSLVPQELQEAAARDERLAPEAQHIKIPQQLWEWECINLCLPSSSYPTGGSSVIEALCARPIEACRIWLAEDAQAAGRHQHHQQQQRQEEEEEEAGVGWGPGASPRGRGNPAGGPSGGQQGKGEGGRGLRRRVPSCPEFHSQDLAERRHSVCVAEVLLRRPAAVGAWDPVYPAADDGGRQEGGAVEAGGSDAPSDGGPGGSSGGGGGGGGQSAGFSEQDGAIGRGGGGSSSSGGQDGVESNGAGANALGAGAGAPTPVLQSEVLAERSASDAALLEGGADGSLWEDRLLVGGGASGRGGRQSGLSRRSLAAAAKRFDATPLEFCSDCKGRRHRV